MSLEAGKFYDCYAEKAEFHAGKPDEQGRQSLSVKMLYRFPESGTRLTFYHVIFKKDGTMKTDKSGVSELEKLSKRYNVDLSGMEFDNTKLTPEIIVRARIGEEEYKGEMQPRILDIYDSSQPREEKPVDKADLMRKFGAQLRAASASVRNPTVSKPNAAPPKAAAAKPKPTPSPKAKAAPKGYQGPDSSMDEVWGLFSSLKMNEGVDEGTMGDQWFEFLQKTFGHQQQERLTPNEWGYAKTQVEAMEQVPF